MNNNDLEMSDVHKMLAHCRSGGQRWMSLPTPEMRLDGMIAHEKGLVLLRIDDKNDDEHNVFAKLTDLGMKATSYTETVNMGKIATEL